MKFQKEQIKKLMVCWVGWFCFVVAAVSFSKVVYRYASGFDRLSGATVGTTEGTALRIFIGLGISLLFAVWWLWVVKNKEL